MPDPQHVPSVSDLYVITEVHKAKNGSIEAVSGYRVGGGPVLIYLSKVIELADRGELITAFLAPASEDAPAKWRFGERVHPKDEFVATDPSSDPATLDNLKNLPVKDLPDPLGQHGSGFEVLR